MVDERVIHRLEGVYSLVPLDKLIGELV